MAKSPKKQKAKKFFRVEYFLIVLLAVVILLFFPWIKSGFRDPVSLEKEDDYFSESQQKKDTSFDIKPALYPVRKESVSELYLSAKAAMAIDLTSGAVLYAKNENVQLWPASTTKLMTALVALDSYSLDSVLTIGQPIKIGRVMDLLAGEKITVENLLYGLLVHSANDSAYAIAQNYPGGEELFILAMNNKAEKLNLENTHFVNPAGFDDDKQYSTAKDLAELSIIALKNPTIAKIVATPAITVHDVEFKYFHSLTTVNKLLGVVPGVAGVKTGWTENAKENLINLTKRNSKEILTVILGSDDRFSETQILTNWVFESFVWQDFSYQPKKDQ